MRKGFQTKNKIWGEVGKKGPATTVMVRGTTRSRALTLALALVALARVDGAYRRGLNGLLAYTAPAVPVIPCHRSVSGRSASGCRLALRTPGPRARRAAAGAASLTARGGDDEVGDITRLLDDSPAFGGGGAGGMRGDSIARGIADEFRSAQTDLVFGTGVGQSAQLQEAIDQAVAAAVTKWPRNSDGQPTVPSLCIFFFSSRYAQQGLGRVLPCLLRTFATTGGKPWKIGVNVIGCSAEGLGLGDPGTPAVSVTLLQSNLLTVTPFCAGDEAAGWSQADWGYKGGLKGVFDGDSTSLLVFGHPSSEDTVTRAAQQLHGAYPTSTMLGGLAGGAADCEEGDKCVIYRKGVGVLNKRGQLIFGEDKEAATYSTSDDLFFDGGTWRRAGLVGAAVSGVVLDAVSLDAGGDDRAQVALARVEATLGINKELSLAAVGGLAFADAAGASLLEPKGGVAPAMQETISAPTASCLLDKVLLVQEEADLSTSVGLAREACSLTALYGNSVRQSIDELSDAEIEAIQGYESSIINSDGQILAIPKYDPPAKKGKRGKKR